MLAAAGETYQPFVFLVSYKRDGEVTDIWFSYYKDLRATQGRLKIGYGPGGPPVLSKGKFLHLLSQLVARDYLTKGEISKSIRESKSRTRSHRNRAARQVPASR